MEFSKTIPFKLVLMILSVFWSTVLYGQDKATDQKALTWNMDDAGLEWAACPEFMPESCRIAVLQGNPAEPNADVFFKMEGNTTVPEHWHHSAERMVLISGEMKVDYASQDPAVLKPGTYAYGPPQHPHEASCISEEPCVLFIAFEEPVDAFQANK